MVLSIEIPDNYGYVFFTVGILPAVTNSFFLSTMVMKARKKFKVEYPNLYATPGFHKNADDFNRVQRGHQHMLESLSDFRAVSFIGGLGYPTICATFGAVYSLGNILYMLGYSDTKLDVKTARLKKGGPILMVALLVNLACAVKFTISVITSE
jgi:glutathione S-transferase